MTTSIHITALDGLVNVNSLFTLAVFVGLAWNPRDLNNSLIDDPLCRPGREIAENMISYHVYSFSSFLFSSIIALSIKQAVRLFNSSHFSSDFSVYINKGLVRVGMMVSSVGTVSGCIFLMLALIDVVQIKLGLLSCVNGTGHSLAAVVPLLILVPAGLLIYVCIVLYAFLTS